MKIQNCLIITDDGSIIHMEPNEQSDFSGNVIWSSELIPVRLLNQLRALTVSTLIDEEDRDP